MNGVKPTPKATPKIDERALREALSAGDERTSTVGAVHLAPSLFDPSPTEVRWPRYGIRLIAQVTNTIVVSGTPHVHVVNP